MHDPRVDETTPCEPKRAEPESNGTAGSPAAGASRAPAFVLPPPQPGAFGETRLVRLGKIGCVAGLVLGVGALLASFFVLERGMQMLGERALTRIEQGLPAELDPAVRARTERNIAQLRVALHSDADAEEILSRFLGLVAPALEDRSLTVEEITDINRGIEDLLDPSGWIVDAPPAPGGEPAPEAGTTR